MIRIGNASGFYGDRPQAFRELLDGGGGIDVITGDYLAELTMLILARDRAKDSSRGYAKTFVGQFQDCIDLARERGVKLVVNAGGLNPAGLAARLRELRPDVPIGYVEGDDVRHIVGGGAIAANAYLGAFGIAECLRRGAQVVVTGRVTDASLTVGPAAAHYGWTHGDLDAIAGAMAAGHVIECGAQATGGNYAFFRTIKDLDHPGFPIAELHEDGSSVITKHPGTGGAVTVGTVTAQLLYEVAGARYPGPDAVLRLDTIRLTREGEDRVRISGVTGEPPPDTLKVGVNSVGGYRNEVTFVLTGLDIEAKADLVKRQMPADTEWTLARTDHKDADTTETASALLHGSVRAADPESAGRRFSDAAVHLALASYPGFHLTAPPGNASPYGVFRSATIPAAVVPHVAVLPDGCRIAIPPSPVAAAEPMAPSAPSDGTVGAIGTFGLMLGRRTRRAPLGTLLGARSGDKGGDANLGVWVETDGAWPWLARFLTTSRLRELIPETAALDVDRHLLPSLRAVNFVIHGLLGDGVAYHARFDPQAKALGELLRSRYADIPEDLL